MRKHDGRFILAAILKDRNVYIFWAQPRSCCQDALKQSRNDMFRVEQVERKVVLLWSLHIR